MGTSRIEFTGTPAAVRKRTATLAWRSSWIWSVSRLLLVHDTLCAPAMRTARGAKMFEVPPLLPDDGGGSANVTPTAVCSGTRVAGAGRWATTRAADDDAFKACLAMTSPR